MLLQSGDNSPREDSFAYRRGPPVPSYPTAEESRERLHRAAWCVGEVGTVGGPWLASGTNGENVIKAWARTPDAAWHRACEQAGAVGMLAPERAEK
jgi:hypothetical protein